MANSKNKQKRKNQRSSDLEAEVRTTMTALLEANIQYWERRLEAEGVVPITDEIRSGDVHEMFKKYVEVLEMRRTLAAKTEPKRKLVVRIGWALLGGFSIIIPRAIFIYASRLSKEVLSVNWLFLVACVVILLFAVAGAVILVDANPKELVGSIGVYAAIASGFLGDLHWK